MVHPKLKKLQAITPDSTPSENPILKVEESKLQISEGLSDDEDKSVIVKKSSPKQETTKKSKGQKKQKAASLKHSNKKESEAASIHWKQLRLRQGHKKEHKGKIVKLKLQCVGKKRQIEFNFHFMPF